MNELVERKKFQIAMPGYKIRSCRLVDDHYVYEAYKANEKPFGPNAPMDPYYYLNDEGSVNQVKVSLNPGKIFSAKIIWENSAF